MLEILADLYRDKLLYLLDLEEERYFELSLERRKYFKTMIGFIRYHLILNNLTIYDLAEHLKVDEEQFYYMTETILDDMLYKEVESLW